MGAGNAQPSLDPLYHALALQAEGNYQASQAACEAIQNVDADKKAKLLHIEALNFFHLRQIDAALNKLDEALILKPDNPQIYEHLIKILLHMQENNLANDSLRAGASSVFKCRSNEYEILFALRRFLVQTENIDWKQYLGFVQMLVAGIRVPNIEVVPDQELQILCDLYCRLNLSENELTIRTTLLLESLNFKKTASDAWNKRLFNHLLLPIMKSLLKCGHLNLALKLEATIYNAFIKQIETESHFTQHFSQWVPAMEAAGKKVSKTLTRMPFPQSGVIKIAFFIHASSRLAHLELLLNMLKGIQSLIEKPFEPRVIIFSGDNNKLSSELDETGISYYSVDKAYPELKDAYFNKIMKVRDYCQNEKITAIVWVSVETLMALSFGIRVAPVQIWWAMKYHGANIQSMDGAVTGGSLSRFKNINGKQWRTARIGHTNWVTPEYAKEAKMTRDKFKPYSILLGSFGREEKLNNQDYLMAVVKILKNNPDCAFLWTGRTELPEIKKTFEDAAVQAQCFYIGWVNTRFYAHAIDIFLDSFPFPCGFTALEAMALGKAIVFFASKESSTTGVRGAITPLLERREGTLSQQNTMRDVFHYGSDNTLYLCAESADEYVAMADSLIKNVEYRDSSGLASAKAVELFFSDKTEMAKSYAEHFLEIIETKRRET